MRGRDGGGRGRVWLRGVRGNDGGWGGGGFLWYTRARKIGWIYGVSWVKGRVCLE